MWPIYTGDNCAFHACDNCKNIALSVASFLSTGERLVKGRSKDGKNRPEFFSRCENTTVCKVFLTHTVYLHFVISEFFVHLKLK